VESDDVSTEQDENQPPEAVRAYAKKYGLVPTFEAKPLKQVKKGETAPESSRAKRRQTCSAWSNIWRA